MILDMEIKYDKPQSYIGTLYVDGRPTGIELNSWSLRNNHPTPYVVRGGWDNIGKSHPPTTHRLEKDAIKEAMRRFMVNMIKCIEQDLDELPTIEL